MKSHIVFVALLLVMLGCGAGSPDAQEHPTNDPPTQPSSMGASSSADPGSTTASNVSDIPTEEPNPNGASCADKNPKKCLDEADAAFNTNDNKTGVKLLLRACDLDEPDGCYVLGNLYAKGIIGGANYKEATKMFVRWGGLLEKACDKSDAEHAARCGRMAGYYEEGSDPQVWNGVVTRIVKQDTAKAATLYKKLLPTRQTLCDQGNAEACFGAGQQLEKGLGTSADPDKAKKLYASSCKLKHPAGCSSAGMLEDACNFGDTPSCDKVCDGGTNDALCDKASPNVKAKAQARMAKAKLPALFQKCAANKTEIEKLRIAGIQAAKRGDKAGAAKATAKLKEIEPGWSATLSEIKTAIDGTTEKLSPEWEQLMIQVRDTCSCDADPDNPGPCKKHTGGLVTRFNSSGSK